MVCPKCGKQFEGVFCPWCVSSAESAELEKRSDEEIAAEEEAFKAEETLKAEEEKQRAEQDGAQKQAEEAAVASGEKIRCPKCGNVFSGNFCPACGAKAIEVDRCPVCGAPHNAGDKFCAKCGYSYEKKPSAAAVTMAGIGAAIKNSCKSALAFCKKHSKKVIAAAVAIALILVIVVPISVVFTSPVQPANVDRIKIGDTQERVLSILGDPYDWEEGDLTFDYYSNNYLKIRKQLDEIANMDDMESFGDLADALEKEEKLNAKLETLEYKQTRVSFDEDGLVEKIVFNASARERSSDEEDKELKSKEILTESVRIYERSDVIYTLKYKDKSIVKAKAQITPEELSDSYTFSIDDPFAPENEIEFSCKVVENPDSDVLYNVTIDDVNYNLTEDGTLTISGNGKVVRDGIKKSGDIKKIEVQEGITEIEQGAFGDCYNLKNITLPFIGASLNALENTHFRYIFGNDNNSVPSTLKKVVITGGTSIGAEAFLNCDSLTSITIPEGVRSIGSYAFSGCSSLTSISIPESVTSIGNYILQGCTGIGSLIIPKMTGILGDYFGEDVENTYNSMVPESLKTVIITGGENITSYAFYGCTSLTNVTIFDGVTNIGAHAFSNCDSLKSIVIPDSVISIGDHAFRDCNSLERIVIPESVTSIGTYILQGCTAIGSLTIPNMTGILGDYFGEDDENNYNSMVPESLKTVIITGGENISSYAFYDCTSLTSITIGGSVKSIDEYAFYGCDSLKEVHISDIAAWCAIDFDVKYDAHHGHTANPLSNGAALYLNGELVTSLEIPESVTSIGYCAFSGCGSLTSITIGGGVTSIGGSAFSGCGSLKEVHISDIAAWCAIDFGNGSANPLSNGAALYLNGELVTSLEIPDSIISIGERTFSGCYLLESIVVEDGNTVYHSEGNCLIETDSKTLIAGCKNSVIPSDGSVTSIGAGAFYNCSSLTSINIPDSVTSIGENAFEGCSSLKEVHISDIAAWCAIDFGSIYANPLYYSAALYLNGELVTSLEIPDSVTSIGYRAFYNCDSLTSITIPDSVTSIGNYAFSSCDSLTSIVIPDSVTSIGGGAFSSCDSLTSINIPESVTSIGSSAFSHCSSLTSIIIPDSVTIIGMWAFSDCSSLTSINFQGSMAQWRAIDKRNQWNRFTGSFTVTCTDGVLDKYGDQVS